MATTDPPKIVRLAARLERVAENRRFHEAAADHLTAVYTTRLDQWGHFLDQMPAAPFSSQHYMALHQEASKAFKDACEVNHQREQE